MKRQWLGGLLAVMLAACGTNDPKLPGTDGGITDPGPDGGGGDGGGPDIDPSLPPDLGAPTGQPGPWPQDAMLSYTERFGLEAVQSVGVDTDGNLWLLHGSRIGFLKGGETEATWSENVGQAGSGNTSTVLCGAPGGKAYVGYAATDVVQPAHDPQWVAPGSAEANFIFGPDGCSYPAYDEMQCDTRKYSAARYANYQVGDVDLVSREDGTDAPKFVTHVNKNWIMDKGTLKDGPRGKDGIGMRNSNDEHFEEDRTVLSCVRMTKGPSAGEIFLGTNHATTRLKGEYYNSHRHATTSVQTGSLIGYVYGVSQAPNGDVLVANDWMLGVHIPTARLGQWYLQESDSPTQDRYLSFLSNFGTPSRQNKADWRAFVQTPDGRYYAGSYSRGLWEVTFQDLNDSTGVQPAGAPARINALAATNDNSVYVGSNDGLYRIDADKVLTKVDGITGRVNQLVYDEKFSPASLYVVTAAGTLHVIRGH